MGCPAGHDSTAEPETPNPSIGSSDHRVVSSIPRSADSNWTYPSAKMFLRSLHQKGHQSVDANQIAQIVLPIHNIVNEKCWTEICKWERDMHGITKPDEQLVLKRFVGRPKTISPKAFVNTFILGYQRPFDRHDWFVSARGQQPKRYVIDFYQGSSDNASPVSIYVDVRPAFDVRETFVYLKGHLRRLFRKE